MIGKPGPFQIIDREGHLDPGAPISPPRRRYDCLHYESCLNLAAALNWDSFTCRGCCGEIEQTLYWRAHQAERRDKLVSTICDLPPLKAHQPGILVEFPKKVAAKG